MFEKEIKFISAYSLSKIKKLGSVVTFEKLSDTELHPAIITYISAELDYMIHKDREKMLNDSIFDYSGKEVTEHFKIITEQVKKNKKISSDDISKLVMQAVSFNANYVVRPKWSLTKFIFNDQNFIAVKELNLMLNYLYYYDYIKNVLFSYISKRKVVQLTITEFDLILNKIDRELFKSNAGELVNNALHSMADFFNLGDVDKNRLALNSVEILLREKNLMDYLLKLRRTVSGVTKKKYEISDIKKILYATKPLKPGSIQGYDPAEMEKVKESKIEPTIEKPIEDYDLDDSEIIKEEEILSSAGEDEEISLDEIKREPDNILPPNPVIDNVEDLLPNEPEFQEEFNAENLSETEPVIDEVEDLLPIEEEFQEEFKKENLLEPEPEIVEPLEKAEENKSEEDKFAEFENEFDKLFGEGIGYNEPDEEKPSSDLQTSEDNSERESVPKSSDTESDEILTFYENELASMEDNDEDLVIVTEEELKKPEEEIKNNATQLTEQNFDIDKELEQLGDKESSSRQEEILSDDDFDLSIFDEAEPDEDIVNNVEHQEEKIDSEIPVEDNIEVKSNPEIPVEKEIINEMLEDYFRDEKKDETKKSKEDTFKLADDELNVEDEEIYSGTKLDSSIFGDSSMDEHISSVISEIDDLLKEEPPAVEEEKKIEPPTEIQKKNEKIENDDIKKDVNNDLDDDFENDLFAEELKSGKKSQVPKDGKPLIKSKSSSIPRIEAPKRGKDFFSYLTKKEMKKIVSLVFGGDDGDFVTTIERISECSAYKEATEILKGVFFSYKVSPYSKEAVLLTNAVSNFFRQT